MAFARRDRRELAEFLELCSSCRSLVDIGASGGFFSVVFASSRSYSCGILSIEPDKGARRVLAELRSKNLRSNVDWRLDERGVMDATRTVKFVSSGYGTEVASEKAVQNAVQCAVANNLRMSIEDVECTTLEKILADHGVVPDVIKIDIESYEFELIASSLDLLRRSKPRIMLELHVSAIEARGLNVRYPLRCLASIGYKPLRSPGKDLQSLAEGADHSGVVRVGLVL
jgi:FkbM family methyltransferase